jgi:hypothetical protein
MIMKKLFILIIGAVMMVSLAGSSAMAKDTAMHHMKGMITAIDTTANTVTIKEANGTTKTVTAEPALIAPLKSGEEVKVTLKADGKTAEKFMVMANVKASK